MSLTQERAQSRSMLIKPNSTHYNFYLLLRAGNNYEGLANITFQLEHIPEYLHIDFNGK